MANNNKSAAQIKIDVQADLKQLDALQKKMEQLSKQFSGNSKMADDIKKFGEEIERLGKRAHGWGDRTKGSTMAPVLKDLEQLKANMKQVQKESGMFSKSYINAVKKMSSSIRDSFKKGFDSARQSSSNATQRMNRDLDSVKQKSKDVGESIARNISNGYAKAAAKARRSKKEIDPETGEPADGTKSKQTASLAERAWSITKSLTLIKGLSNITDITSYIGNAFGQSVKDSAQFTRTMSVARNILGATAADMKELSDMTVKLGRDFGKTSVEAAELVVTLSRMGVAKENMEGVAKAASKLAQLVGGDINTAAEVLLQTMNAFGESQDKAGVYAKKFVAYSNSAAIDLQQFATVMNYVGASAEACGVSFDTAATMATLLRNQGLSASIVGTSMRNIFIELADKGTDFVSVLKKMHEGIITYNDAVDLVGKRAANAFVAIGNDLEKFDEIQERVLSNASNNMESFNTMVERNLGLMVQFNGQNLWNKVTTAVSGFLEYSDEKMVERKLTNNHTNWAGLIGNPALRNALGGERAGIETTARMASSMQYQLYRERNQDKNLVNLTMIEKDAIVNEISKEFEDVINGISDYKWAKLYGTQTKEEAIKIGRENIEASLADDSASATKAKAKSSIEQTLRSEFYDSQKQGKEWEEAVIKTKIAEVYRKYGVPVTPEEIDSDVALVTNTNFKGISHKSGAQKRIAELNSLMSNMMMGDYNLYDLEQYESWKREKEQLEAQFYLKDLKEKKGYIAAGSLNTAIENLTGKDWFKRDKNQLSAYTENMKVRLDSAETEEEREAIRQEYIRNSANMILSMEGKGARWYESKKGDISRYKGMAKEIYEHNTALANKKFNSGQISELEYRNDLNKFDAQHEQQITDLDTMEAKIKGSVADIMRGMQELSATIIKVDTGFERVFDDSAMEQLQESMDEMAESMNDFRLDKFILGTKSKKEKKKAVQERANLRSSIAAARTQIGVQRLQNEQLWGLQSGRLNSDITDLSGKIDFANSDEFLKSDKYKEIVAAGMSREEYVADLTRSRTKAQEQLADKRAGYLSRKRKLDTNETTLAQSEYQLDQIEESEDMEKYKRNLGLTKDVMQGSVDLYKEIQNMMLEEQRKRIEQEIANEKEKNAKINSANKGLLELGVINQAQYADMSRKLEEEEYEKSNKLMEKQFNAEKKAQKQQATLDYGISLANIALNLMMASSKKGVAGLIEYPIALAAYTALATGQYAAKMAAIGKQKYIPQKYADGGYVSGPSHAEGGIPISVGGSIREMEGGEYIVNRASTAKYRSLLDSINNDTMTSTQSNSGANMEAILAALNKPVRAYIVSADLGKDNKYRTIVSDKTSL